MCDLVFQRCFLATCTNHNISRVAPAYQPPHSAVASCHLGGTTWALYPELSPSQTSNDIHYANKPSSYPTYEELIITTPPHEAISLNVMRLRWFLQDDDPSSAITVLQDAADATSTQEPYSPNHPISRLALTTSPVSAITVSIDILDDYSVEWTFVHQVHAEPEDSPENTGERFDADGKIEHCCDEDRPGTGPEIEIMAAPGSFVTIGQFVETVHPWLRELESLLRAAKGVIYCVPLEPDVPMFVWPNNVSQLRIGSGKQMKVSLAYNWANLAKMAASMQRKRDA